MEDQASDEESSRNLTAEALPTSRPVVAIPRLDAAPTLENFLNMAPEGPVAQKMVMVTGFIQQEPEDGQPASQRTEVYLGYDNLNLYAVFVAFVHELTQELLEQDVEYKNSKGIDFANPLWHVVAHIFNHQTHHRGQVTTLLSQIGTDPGITDFLITTMMPMPELD